MLPAEPIKVCMLLIKKAHCDMDVAITPYKLKRALNSKLHPNIHINDVIEVDKSFMLDI